MTIKGGEEMRKSTNCYSVSIVQLQRKYLKYSKALIYTTFLSSTCYIVVGLAGWKKKSLAAKINAAFSQETGKIMTMSSSEEIPLLHKTA